MSVMKVVMLTTCAIVIGIFVVFASLFFIMATRKVNDSQYEARSASLVKTDQPTTGHLLRPADTAFGYTLGGYEQVQPEMILHDPPMFNGFSLDVSTVSSGQICQIQVSGTISELDLSEPDKQVIQTLTEKYGLRYHAYDSIEYEFGTTNRPVHLTVSDDKDGKFFIITYSDQDLMAVFNKENAIKEEQNQQEKKAALSSGL